MKDQQDFYDNMSDHEIRVIGETSSSTSFEKKDAAVSPQIMEEPLPPKNGWFRWWYLLIAAVAVCIGIIAYLLLTQKEETTEVVQQNVEESYETVAMDSLVTESETKAYCEERIDSVNDINLHIVTPIGCLPELLMGKMPEDTASFVMIAQAADVRGDNGEISGAYVYKGELISKGKSKLGFCAIIGNEITLGRQTETPLFERAIEANGYFFRQYSLVNEGQMIDIKPKGKALRRALCYYEGKIVIIESTEKESFHDFSQALADLGVEEAVALVGGDALFRFVDEEGEQHYKGSNYSRKYENVNYIVWKK